MASYVPYKPRWFASMEIILRTVLLLTCLGKRVPPVAAMVAALFLAALSPAVAQPGADPAAARAEAFSTSLLAASKRTDAKAGRLHRLIEQSFNIPVMAQIAVGPTWATKSESEHAAIVEALTRYTAARFEHDLGQGSGQKIVLEPNVQVRGPDRLVKGQILEPGEPAVRLAYRLREYGGTWKIIDIFYDGVSQLATERADFASALTGGASALVRRLNDASVRLGG